MANKQATATTIKKPSTFKTWYNGPAGQRTVGAFYSVGASVVILGALFKIMHWPGAGWVLSAGMITEAVLFFIGVFEKPHKTYHWENVHPSLLIDNEGPVAANSELPVGVSSSIGQGNTKMLEDGIKHLAETAGQLGNISDAALASSKFGKSLSDASEAVSSFTTKQKGLDEVSSNMMKSYQDITSSLANVNEGTKKYAENSVAIQNSISAINSVYELELKNIQAQAEAISAQTSKITSASADIDKVFATLGSTVKEMETYKEQTEMLAKHVSDLNSVYGNMLNAIKN